MLDSQNEGGKMLIKCKECGKDVSTEAASCPHCGCPLKQGQVGIPKCTTCGSTEVEQKNNKRKRVRTSTLEVRGSENK